MFLFVVLAVALGYGQKPSKSISAKIDSHKPGVYISEVSPESPPQNSQVWLRLHNNYRWGIVVCQYDKANIAKKILGLHFEMERIDTSAMVQTPQPIDGQLITPSADGAFPRGNPTYGGCDAYELSPGQAVDFPVVRDNFIRWARLKVPFFMKWENVQETSMTGEPRHYAYFYSRKLVVE